MNHIKFAKLSSIDEIQGDDEVETSQLKALAERAKNFILGFRWCKGIVESYYGGGVDNIVAVLLFKIEPGIVGVDEWLWVIVGDLPPAYLVTDVAPESASALKAYVREMRRWVEAVNSGNSTKELIPVNAPATPQYAQMLKSRLDTLEEEFIPLFEEMM